MRTISEIVIHHTVTPKNQTVEKTIASIDRNHKARLHPVAGKLGHIAYHYLIFSNGRVVTTRPEDEVGFHASNLSENKKSLGVALVGNYDIDTIEPPMRFALRDLVKAIKSRHFIKLVVGHRKFAQKTCPGKKFTDKMIEEAFHPKV